MDYIIEKLYQLEKNSRQLVEGSEYVLKSRILLKLSF